MCTCCPCVTLLLLEDVMCKASVCQAGLWMQVVCSLSDVGLMIVSCLCVYGHDECNDDLVAPCCFVDNDNIYITVKGRYPERIRLSRSERKIVQDVRDGRFLMLMIMTLVVVTYAMIDFSRNV